MARQSTENPGAVIFDLDGTLLDTLEDLACSMNAALVSLGHKPHEVDAFRGFVGDGISMLALRSLPEDRRNEESVRLCVEAMRLEYGKRCMDKTRPYSGIRDLLHRLQEKNCLSQCCRTSRTG